MKFLTVLALATSALAAAVETRGGNLDPVITRTFDLPPNPVNTPPPGWPGRDKRDTIEAPDGTPNPDEVEILGFTYGGTGCPSGTVSSVFSDDRTVVTLIFDEYIVQIGPDVSIREARKNCQLNLHLRYPGGFQYSVFSADYRGYAYLEEGVTGVQKSTYYFSGQTEQTSTSTTWVGPIDQDYLVHDEANMTSVVWSPCGTDGAMNINSQIRLTSDDDEAEGLLTTDSIDGSFRQIVHIKWQECQEESS